MGQVFLAHDTLLDRLVAVKFIDTENADKRAIERVMTEARTAARVQHPNVVSIFQVGMLDGHPFIISEYIRGTSLNKLKRPLSDKRVLDIGSRLARGLAAVHRQGILHCDIKPANTMLGDEGEIKLLDFGLANFTEAAAHLRHDTVPLRPFDISDTRSAFSERMSLDDSSRMRPDADDRLDPFANTHQVVVAPRAVTESSLPDTDPLGDTLLADLQAAAPTSRVSTDGPTPASSPPGQQKQVWGTPRYMAPESWFGEPATRRTDVYSLGVMLYELRAGRTPFAEYAANVLALRVTELDPPTLSAVVDDVDPSLAAVIDRCIQRDPNARFGSADELREALEALAGSRAVRRLPPGNPYRGLLAFEAEHRGLFFGRDTEVRALLERLRAYSLVIVAGDSGVGKSSLCRAGVLPHLQDGALEDQRDWRVAYLVPGRNPLASLATALATQTKLPAGRVLGELRDDPVRVARRVQTEIDTSAGLTIFVDQLEELVTESDPAAAAAFGAFIGCVAEGARNIRVLATSRSDYLARLATVPSLGDEVAGALYLLRPMGPSYIRDAIVGPARLKGVSFESEALVDMLVDATISTQGSLPLLQFALAELWDARASGCARINSDALQAIGGVSGALARHADHVVLGLSQPQRKAVRSILTCLVTVEGTRARRARNELPMVDSDADAALDAMVQARLLVVHETDAGAVYEVAHEALIADWDTLRRWLDEDMECRILKERLELCASDWQRSGRSRDALWNARQIAEVDRSDGLVLQDREKRFLQASRRARRRRRLIRGGIIVAIPLTLIVVYSLVQLDSTRERRERVAAHVDSGERIVAKAAQTTDMLDDARKRAFAAFDARQPEDGERLWSISLRLAGETERLWRDASQAFEAALTVDGTRADVRERLGQLLYARALATQLSGTHAMHDELVQRMEVYDSDGALRSQWYAPAHLTIRTDPPGASVRLQRYMDTGDHGTRLVGDRDLGRTPVTSARIVQGSYLLTVTALDRQPVRYPIVLKRAEQLSVTIPLVRATDIPEGYIYIPPGRFLFGSSDTEMVRKMFLSAVPIHEVWTHGYLIARYETTYADWLQYVRSLPPEQRAKQQIFVGRGAMSGTLKLTELDGDVWQLDLQPTVTVHTARTGQPLVYSTRARRRHHDWSRLPVSGIDVEQAVGYTAWLSSTGRVPGARLCSELEWERAARGADRRVFPHGDRMKPDDANIDITYGKQIANMGPDEVGSHPTSISPFGVEDMAGNVFEWTRSSVEVGKVAVRGGAYFYDQTTAQALNRTVFDEDFRDPALGLRVCAPAP